MYVHLCMRQCFPVKHAGSCFHTLRRGLVSGRPCPPTPCPCASIMWECVHMHQWQHNGLKRLGERLTLPFEGWHNKEAGDINENVHHLKLVVALAKGRGGIIY